MGKKKYLKKKWEKMGKKNQQQKKIKKIHTQNELKKKKNSPARPYSRKAIEDNQTIFFVWPNVDYLFFLKRWGGGGHRE